MTLSGASNEARRLAQAGDYGGAEAALRAVEALLAHEEDPDVLKQYAALCHEWGPPEAEEAALRTLVRRRPDLANLEALLDLLQERLNAVTGPARDVLVDECEAWGTAAIECCTWGEGLTWANLVRSRSQRRLDQVRRGRHDQIGPARGDLEAYLQWLTVSPSVPPHLRRDNLAAFAQVDLAELALNEGRPSQAAGMLEEAITALEMTGVANWLVDPAYLLLARAEEAR